MQLGMDMLARVALSELVNVKSKKLNSWITAVMRGHSIGGNITESSDGMQPDTARKQVNKKATTWVTSVDK